VTRKWQPFPLGTTPAVLVRSVPSVLRRTTGLKNDGTESVGGADTYKVTGQVAASVVAPLLGVSASGKTVSFTIWVGQKDSILRRARVDGPVAPKEPSDIARTVELSKFNEAVTIAPPATG